MPVTREIHHIERFRMPGARVYEALIQPGSRTDYHRHDRETLYVVLRDGRFRSVQPRGQSNATRLGRSVGPRRTLGLLAGRLRGGWLRMPGGTVLMQHHLAHPLVHRVENGGDTPLRMLGVELDGSVAPPASAGGRPEYRDSSVLVLRVNGSLLAGVPDAPAVAVVVRGSTDVDGRSLRAGDYARTDAPRTIRVEATTELLLIYP